MNNESKTKSKRKKREKVDPNHYIDNKEFTAATIEYVEKSREAAAKGEDSPIVSEYIGECIVKIAERTASRHNFRDYTYRDEMVSEGIISCLRAVGNFNFEKSNNAFAYFTTICWWAFVRKINEEEKRLYNKYSLARKQLLYDLPEED